MHKIQDSTGFKVSADLAAWLKRLGVTFGHQCLNAAIFILVVTGELVPKLSGHRLFGNADWLSLSEGRG
jgi:hypothetical protein